MKEFWQDINFYYKQINNYAINLKQLLANTGDAGVNDVNSSFFEDYFLTIAANNSHNNISEQEQDLSP